MYLVTSTSKFSDYIRRQKSGIASGDIDISIVNLQITVQYIFKLWNMLNFIKKDVIHITVLHQGIYMVKQGIRIPQGDISSIFQINFNYVVVFYPLLFQV